VDAGLGRRVRRLPDLPVERAEFRRSGAEVVAVDLPGEALDEVGREPGVHPVAGQLSSRAEVRRVWEQIDSVGTPTALVALVGGFRPSSLADLTEEIWRTRRATFSAP